jgi:hypothetical protein
LRVRHGEPLVGARRLSRAAREAFLAKTPYFSFLRSLACRRSRA